MTVQRCLHSDLHVYDDAQRWNTCHKTSQWNSWLGCRNCLFFLLVRSPSWSHQWQCSTWFIIIHLLYLVLLETQFGNNLSANYHSISWLPSCHQYLTLCKPASQTDSPNHSRKLQCTNAGFSFKPIFHDTFPLSCPWEQVMGSSSRLHPRQTCFHLYPTS